jgi:hypothetical protein
MQRTRRIQITRYRRRVTVTQGEPTAVEIAEEGLEEDSIFQVLQSIPAMSEGSTPKTWFSRMLNRKICHGDGRF